VGNDEYHKFISSIDIELLDNYRVLKKFTMSSVKTIDMHDSGHLNYFIISD
jgi:hypothetical protein